VNPTPRDHDRRPGDGEQETPPPTGTADSPFDDHTAPLAAAGPDPAPPSAPGPDDQTPPAADPELDPGEADGLAWSRSGTPAPEEGPVLPDQRTEAFDDKTEVLQVPAADRRVLDPEADLPDGEPMSYATRRLPTYEELSADRPVPAPVPLPEADDDLDQAWDREEQRAHQVEGPAPVEVTDDRRGTLGVGLLILRAVLGLVMIGHGLQKLTGWFNGPGIDGFKDFLDSVGYDYASVFAYLTPITEVVAGVLLVVGVITPVAAAAVIAVLINAWCVMKSGTGWRDVFGDPESGGQVPGIELESILLLMAIGVGLAGPGRISADFSRGWARRPAWGSTGIVVLGIAAGIVTWWVFQGTNPL